MSETLSPKSQPTEVRRRSTRQMSVRFGSMEDRASEALRRRQRCLTGFSEWDGYCGFLELADLRQALVSFRVVIAKKRKMMDQLDFFIETGAAPLEMGPSQCASIIYDLSVDLLSDEFDSLLRHLSRTAGVIEAAAKDPPLLRRRRVLYNLFSRWDRTGNGLLEEAPVVKLLQRLGFTCDVTEKEEVRSVVSEEKRIESAEVVEGTPSGCLDIVGFVDLMHGLLDTYEDELEWHANAQRVFARVDAEIGSYATLAIAYSGMGHNVREGVEKAEMEARHAFDSITTTDITKFLALEPDAVIELCCNPACVILGLLPEALPDSDQESFLKPLQRLFEEQSESLLDHSRGVLKRFPRHAVTYKMIRTVVDEVHSEWFEPTRLLTRGALLAALVEWSSHLLQAVCIFNNWDFTDVPVYAPTDVQGPEFPLLKAPPQDEPEAPETPSTAKQPRPPFASPGSVIGIGKLRSATGPLAFSLPSANNLSQQEVARVALEGRRGGRRLRSGGAPSLLASPQPPRSTVAMPLQKRVDGTVVQKGAPWSTSPRAIPTVAPVALLEHFSETGAFETPQRITQRPDDDEPTPPTVHVPTPPSAVKKEEAKKELMVARVPEPPPKRELTEEQKARRRVDEEARAAALREFEEEERWRLEAFHKSEEETGEVVATEYARYKASIGDRGPENASERQKEADQQRAEQQQRTHAYQRQRFCHVDEAPARDVLECEERSEFGVVKAGAAQSRLIVQRITEMAADEMRMRLLAQRLQQDDTPELISAGTELAELYLRLSAQETRSAVASEEVHARRAIALEYAALHWAPSPEALEMFRDETRHRSDLEADEESSVSVLSFTAVPLAMAARMTTPRK
eukprot:Hpha_TRINITY_DN15252_c2_g3::TRINITY_DN15252_c2_g3_i1::g.68096::m.68096